MKTWLKACEFERWWQGLQQRGEAPFPFPPRRVDLSEDRGTGFWALWVRPLSTQHSACTEHTLLHIRDEEEESISGMAGAQSSVNL